MRVAAMGPQDLPLEAIEAICKRVQLAAARGFLGIVGLGVCVNLVHARHKLDKMGRTISAMNVRTAADRSLLHKVAQFHQRIADAMSSDRDRKAAMQPRPFFRFAIVRLLDALVVQAEDVAETAALGASAEFADLVEEELKGRSAAGAVG